MGYLAPEPVDRPHYCTQPAPAQRHAEGTRWQCDYCKTIYRVEMVTDRNITQLEWVKRKATGPRKPGQPYLYESESGGQKPAGVRMKPQIQKAGAPPAAPKK